MQPDLLSPKDILWLKTLRILPPEEPELAAERDIEQALQGDAE